MFASQATLNEGLLVPDTIFAIGILNSLSIVDHVRIYCKCQVPILGCAKVAPRIDYRTSCFIFSSLKNY